MHNTSDLVTKIAEETAARIRPATDLRTLQTTLWSFQKTARDPRRAKAEKKRQKMRLYRWRNRVRPELPGREGFRVIDRLQTLDGRKFLELSNGMRIRLDKAHQLGNVALRKLVQTEVERNLSAVRAA